MASWSQQSHDVSWTDSSTGFTLGAARTAIGSIATDRAISTANMVRTSFMVQPLPRYRAFARRWSSDDFAICRPLCGLQSPERAVQAASGDFSGNARPVSRASHDHHPVALRDRVV